MLRLQSNDFGITFRHNFSTRPPRSGVIYVTATLIYIRTHAHTHTDRFSWTFLVSCKCSKRVQLLRNWHFESKTKKNPRVFLYNFLFVLWSADITVSEMTTIQKTYCSFNTKSVTWFTVKSPLPMTREFFACRVDPSCTRNCEYQSSFSPRNLLDR